MKSFSVERGKPQGRYKLPEIFKGLTDSPALVDLFKDETERTRILNETTVEITASEDYMHVSDEDGRLIVGSRHLKKAREQTLYLDIIHELAHVKQFEKGEDLYDPRYGYIDRPTELEAYKLSVKEARRLGWSEREIADYLLVDWITKEQRDRLAQKLGVKI